MHSITHAFRIAILLLATASFINCSGLSDDADAGEDTSGQTQDPGDGPGQGEGGTDVPDPEETSVSERLLDATGLVGNVVSETVRKPAENVTATELVYESTDDRPMALFVLEAKLSGGIAVTMTTPFDEGRGNGLQTVTDQALAVDDSHTTIYAGTNGDYFTVSGHPQGIFHHLGEALKTDFNETPVRPRSFFYVTRRGVAATATASEYEAISAQNIIYEACGGGAVLVEDGAAVENPSNTSEDLAANPRTSVGVSEDGKTVWLAVIDGRKSGYSGGYTLSELAQVMDALGCWSAINLDGGGSSTFYIRTDTSEDSFSNPDRFEILNSPSDGSPRKVWNGIAIIRRTL